jgi:16S rRNA (uracil1498-N3)-methyltransferase
MESDVQKRTTVRIVRTYPQWGARNYSLHIAIAPTKNMNRFEWFIEKATEIGIDEITPLICEHAERKTIQSDRLKKIMIAALKQSVKTTLPLLNEPVKLPAFMKMKACPCKYMAHYDPSNVHLKDNYCRGENVLVLIGPEGDFSPEELLLASDAGFKQVNLGTSRLRTETAGIMVCSLINLLNA